MPGLVCGAQRREREAAGTEQAHWCRLRRSRKVLQVPAQRRLGVDSAMEAELARAHALVRGTNGKDALELRAALERARAALAAGATVQDALAEMEKAPTARNDARSTPPCPSSVEAAAAEELVTVIESLAKPEVFDPYCTPAALGPGGKQLHDRLAALCSNPWFERLAIAALVAHSVVVVPFLSGVPGPFLALTWATLALFLALFSAMNQICSFQ